MTTPGVLAPPAGLPGLRRVKLEAVRPCRFQPRKEFSAEALRELADSIKEKGIVQPLLVRPDGDHFELIAGERRWRAAQLAGLDEVPVVIREADDRTVLELALVENLQRENLNPIEEASGYAQLIEQFQLSQEEAAAKVGKSRTVVTNAVRLLRLPAPVQEWLRQGRLSVGHAKVILGLADAELQLRAAERVLETGMSVRETEEVVADPARLLPPPTSARSGRDSQSRPRDVHVTDLENRLRQHLGTKVRVRYRKGKGALEIRFFSDGELERLLLLLGLRSE